MIKKTLFILFALVVIFYVRGVSAVDATSITVYPTIQDIKVTSGIEIRTQINFRNGGNKTLMGNIKVADYEVIDKQGSIRLIENENMKPKYAASSWLTLLDDFIAIPKGETVPVTIVIIPPPDLTACGYYSLVYFQPSEKSELDYLNVSTKIGGFLNFIVDNKTCNEKISITHVDTPTFLENGPIPIAFALLNQGDIHLTPSGFISASDILKQFVDQKSIKEMKIFPEKEKEYSASVGKKWMFGRYKILINVSYGLTVPKTISKIVYVWVFPWKIFILILLALIVFYLFIKHLYRVTNHKQIKGRSNVDTLKEQISKRE